MVDRKENISPDMQEKAAHCRIELQRIKDNPRDAEERALKAIVLDGMSDPKLWYDTVALPMLFGVEHFSKGFRAALGPDIPWWASMWITGDPHPNRFDTCKLCGEEHPAVPSCLEEHSRSHLK